MTPHLLSRTLLPVLTFSLLTSPLARAADPLVPGQPLTLAGTTGRFDFIVIDSERRRLLAAHTGNASLDVIDLEKNELIKAVPTGAAQSCAIDRKGGTYLVAVSKPPQMTIVDAKTLTVTGKVPLDGPADLLAFEEKSGAAYVDHDDGKEIWVVSPKNKKVVTTITLPSDSPEDLAFDPSGQRLFQALKTASTIAVIDVPTGKVAANWSTAPATAPHGIALVQEFKALVIAGGNSKLALLSTETGKVLASTDLLARVDEIAYDAELHRVYCASGSGKIAIYTVAKDALTKLGEVASAEGAHSIAVDPQTHSVWIAYAKGPASMVQSFTVPK